MAVRFDFPIFDGPMILALVEIVLGIHTSSTTGIAPFTLDMKFTYSVNGEPFTQEEKIRVSEKEMEFKENSRILVEISVPAVQPPDPGSPISATVEMVPEIVVITGPPPK